MCGFSLVCWFVVFDRHSSAICIAHILIRLLIYLSLIYVLKYVGSDVLGGFCLLSDCFSLNFSDK